MTAITDCSPPTDLTASNASGQAFCLRIELGHTDLRPERACRLEAGTVVALDQQVREPIEIFADDRLIARGELVVIENKLCVRVTERIRSHPQ
jgi:flagellar motor switch protein FliN